MGIEMLRGALDKAVINSSVTQYWRVSVVDVTASTQNDLAALARFNQREIKKIGDGLH